MSYDPGNPFKFTQSKDFAVATYDHIPLPQMVEALNHVGKLGYEVMLLVEGENCWVATFRRGGVWQYEPHNLEAGAFTPQRLSTMTEKAVLSGGTLIFYHHPDARESRFLVIKSRVYDPIKWA